MGTGTPSVATIATEQAASTTAYCLAPSGSAIRFGRALKRYAEETGINAVIDARVDERRSGNDRRAEPWPGPNPSVSAIERRRIPNSDGRPVAARRGPTLPPPPPPPPPPPRPPVAPAALFS